MTQSVAEQLELAKQRVEQITTRRNRIQVQLEAARQQYAEAVAEATSTYGTADLDRLRATLVEQEQNNAKIVSEYVKAVDAFESYVEKVEKALADPEAMNAFLLTIAQSASTEAVPAATAEARAPEAEAALSVNYSDAI